MSLQRRQVIGVAGDEPEIDLGGAGATDAEDLALCDMVGATTFADHPGGSADDFVAWLQVSFDGLAWFDLPCDLRMGTVPAVFDVFPALNKRNISNESPVDFPGRLAILKHLPAALCRVQWIAEGSELFDTKLVLTAK